MNSNYLLNCTLPRSFRLISRKPLLFASLIALIFSLTFTACKDTEEPYEDENVALTSVSLNKTSLSMETGDTEALTVSFQPANATNKNVTWILSAPSIATVVDGAVTAVAAGTATITVTTADGGITAQCTVTVTTGVPVIGVSLNKTSLTLIKGGTEALTVSFQPTNATNKNVTWNSDAPGIATVVDGTVIAVAAGTATITVTTAKGNKTASCTVTVIDPATYFGTYTATYMSNSNKSITETITILDDRFYISDNEKENPTEPDYLDFKIEKWENFITPNTYNSDYPIAFKITGKIILQKGYVPSTNTAPKFDATTDVKGDGTGPDCWMYIFFDDNENRFTLLRSPFSKSDQYNGTNTIVRVYTKAP